MVNDTYAVPATRQIATTDKDTWSFDFSSVLDSETVTGGAATLVRVQPPYLDTIAEFVTLAEAVDETVEVTWDASVLTRGESYELLTVAELSSGAAKTLVVRIEVTS